MASPQFLHLLEQMHKTAQRRRLPWQPVERYASNGRCNFRLALGNGIVRIEANDREDSEYSFEACCTAYLTTREGMLIDEIVAKQHESENYPMLREIYEQALVAAFDLPGLVEGMQEDLESGKVRDLPKDKVKDSEIPF
jgi:hypothetical protein